jgi:hypothetical protein
MVVGVVQLLACAALAAQTLPPLRTYSQQIAVEYATADDAGRATVGFAPVYDGREWAFSARWDDCNPNSLQMRQHMAKFGLKGTFYLTQNDKKNSFGPDFCKELMREGFSIGGHTMTHPKLPELKAGAIWWELLANRVAREDDTETTLNSLAFSYGQFRSKNPEAFQMISEAVRRAGYHHCVYSEFVRSNSNLAPGEFSTGCQVVPGDRVVNAQAFQEQLAKPMKWPETYRQLSHCIFLGVHPWQTGEEWNKLDAVFQTITAKSEWWYCNQTEWAAYSRQVTRSELKTETTSAAATMRHYMLTRPTPGELGASVPLTCVIGKANVKGLKVDGQPVSFEKRGATVVVNLPHGQGQVLPQRISHIEVPATAQTLEKNLQCADFPDMKGLLVADPAQRKASLTLAAPAAGELRDLHIRFRLPLQYEPGIVIQTVKNIKAGTQQTVEIVLPATKTEAFWEEGPQYWVAEIDFTGPTGSGRLFVTRLVP